MARRLLCNIDEPMLLLAEFFTGVEEGLLLSALLLGAAPEFPLGARVG